MFPRVSFINANNTNLKTASNWDIYDNLMDKYAGFAIRYDFNLRM